MTDVELLPLPGSLSHWLKMRASDSEESAVMHVAVHHHARAVAEHNVKALQAELDNRWATGVHSCHDKCQRIACVLRRERDAAVYALTNTERSLAAARKARDLFDDRAERLAEALRWYVENDDTNEGQEGNEYWLAGRDRAIAVLRDHDQEGKDG